MNISKNISNESKLKNKETNSKNKTLSQQATKALNKFVEIGDKLKNTAIKTKNNISEGMNSTKKKIEEKTIQNPNVMKPLDSLVTITTQFEQSNSAITKFVFIILMLILFIIGFQAGMYIIQTFIGPKRNPILVDGLVDSNKVLSLSADPNRTDSKPIYRSINQSQGLEFTWSVWFYIENIGNGRYQRIFSKGGGDKNLSSSNISSAILVDQKVLVSSPGLFITNYTLEGESFPLQGTNLDKTHGNLLLILNTFQPSNSDTEFAEYIIVNNIPINKWVNCSIRVENTTVDMYINGVMTQRHTLNNLPRQNYYDTYVGDTIEDGFIGNISYLRYYDRALRYDEIQDIFGKGPNLKKIDDTSILPGNDYISTSWYYNLTK
jgi:hypothetical protein